MRETGGRIVLMDFGAARVKAPGDTEMLDGVAGTPLYMAPELFDGQESSQASDIYALGVLLFHLVTNRFPVEAESVQGIRQQHARYQRTLLRDIRPDLPESFVNVVEQAMARTPGARYGSAGQMEQALWNTLPTERTALTRRLGALAVLAAAVGSLGMLGFLETRAFQIFLGVPDAFSNETPLTYLQWGLRSMLAFSFYWIVLIFAIAVLIAIGALVRLMRRSTHGPPRDRWWTRLDPTAAAMMVFAIGAVAWLGITVVFSDLFGAMTSLMEPNQAPDLTLLGAAGDGYKMAREQAYAYLSLGLGIAVWRLFPRKGQEASDLLTTRIIRWATISICLLSVALAVLPYRIVWAKFPIVTLDDQRLYVLEENDESLLLYDPYAINLADRTRVVPRNDQRVTSSGPALGLFVQ